MTNVGSTVIKISNVLSQGASWGACDSTWEVNAPELSYWVPKGESVTVAESAVLTYFLQEELPAQPYMEVTRLRPLLQKSTSSLRL